MRLFVSLEPPDSLKVALGQLQSELKRCLSGESIRWSSLPQTHLTLKFLGELDEAVVPDVKARLEAAAAAAQPFQLRVEGLGFFPSQGRPRICWVGLEGALPHLNRLQQAVEEAMEPWVPREQRPFSPHLTLGKVRREARGLSRVLKTLPESVRHRLVGSWEVEDVRLMQSLLLPQGARHERVAGYRLGPR